MSKGYKNRASEVDYFIDFNFAIFAMFKTNVLFIYPVEYFLANRYFLQKQ